MSQQRANGREVGRASLERMLSKGKEPRVELRYPSGHNVLGHGCKTVTEAINYAKNLPISNLSVYANGQKVYPVEGVDTPAVSATKPGQQVATVKVEGMDKPSGKVALGGQRLWEEIAYDHLRGYQRMVHSWSDPGVGWVYVQRYQHYKTGRPVLGAAWTEKEVKQWTVRSMREYEKRALDNADDPSKASWRSTEGSTRGYSGGSGYKYQKPDVGAKVKAVPHTPTGFPRIDDEVLLNDPTVKEFLDMLTYTRKAWSDGENDFIKKYITDRFDGRKAEGIYLSKDKFGNRFVKVTEIVMKGNAVSEVDPSILFSCHTDTVHRNPLPKTQKVCFGDGRVWADDSSCLGGDDTCGIWLMSQMIEAKVPGWYVFHRAEEIGGLGSAAIAKAFAGKLRKMKAAIAFDRKGYDDIITHQGGVRTASDKFVVSLAEQLGGKFAKSTGGTFTDTKNYIDLIGECTNVSCGYHNAHGPMEWVDVSFLSNLRDQLLKVDWSKLVFERKAGDREKAAYRWDDWDAMYGGGYGSYGGYNDHKSDDKPVATKSGKRTDPRPPIQYDKLPTVTATHFSKTASSYISATRSREMVKLEDLMLYATAYPETVGAFLYDHGFTAEDVADWFKKLDYAHKTEWDREEGGN